MAYIVSHYALKMRRACRLVKPPRSVQYYCSRKDPRHDLRARMREILTEIGLLKESSHAVA